MTLRRADCAPPGANTPAIAPRTAATSSCSGSRSCTTAERLGHRRAVATKALVEHGDRRAPCGRPAFIAGQGRVCAVPRPEKIAGAEQVRAAPAGEHHLVRDEPTQQQCRERTRCRRRARPATSAVPELAARRDQDPLREGRLIGGDGVAQTRVDPQQRDSRPRPVRAIGRGSGRRVRQRGQRSTPR
jgi:hypothetical protein